MAFLPIFSIVFNSFEKPTFHNYENSLSLISSVVENNSQKIADKVFSGIDFECFNKPKKEIRISGNDIVTNTVNYSIDDEYEKQATINNDEFVVIKNNLSDIYSNFDYYFPGLDILDDKTVDNDFLNKETQRIITLTNDEIYESQSELDKYSFEGDLLDVNTRCGSVFKRHFWKAVGWEAAVAVSWVFVIGLWGASIACDLYSLFDGSGFDGDWDGSLKTLLDLQQILVIKSALNFKKDTGCRWSYKW